MKLCPNCHSALEDGTVFCTSCGCIVPACDPGTDEPVSAQPEVIQSNVVSDTVVAVENESAPKKGKGKLIGLICGGVLLAGVIVFVIIGFVTNWFGGPLGGLVAAFDKTVKADSMTIEMDLDVEINDDSASGELTFMLVVDKENRELTALLEADMENDTRKVLIVDDKAYSCTIGNDGEVRVANVEDIPKDTLDTLFDFLNGELESDEEELEDLLKQLEIDADAEEFQEFLNELRNDCFMNQQWLEEYMGFEKKNDKYIFEIDYEDFIVELAERAYNADIISRSQYKQAKDLNLNLSLDFEFKVKDGYVTGAYLGMEYDGISINCTIDINDINDTEISESIIDSVKDDVNSYFAKYYTDCAGCGKNGHKDSMYTSYNDYYCSDCYQKRRLCDNCYKFVLKDTMTYTNGEYWCVDCNDVYLKDHKCDLCSGTTGSNYICYEHSWYDNCDHCGNMRNLGYYHIKSSKKLCYNCFYYYYYYG